MRVGDWARIAARFWAKVDFTGPVPVGTAAEGCCWDYRPAVEAGGYGSFNIGPRCHKAHRIAWQLEVGPIPEGLVLDHICRRTSCVRPTHLRLGTQKQNMQNLPRESHRNPSGLRGVLRAGRSGQWVAAVRVDGVTHRGPKRADVAAAAADVRALRLSLQEFNDVDRLPA